MLALQILAERESEISSCMMIKTPGSYTYKCGSAPVRKVNIVITDFPGIRVQTMRDRVLFLVGERLLYFPYLNFVPGLTVLHLALFFLDYRTYL